jgi:hypothetical protein
MLKITFGSNTVAIYLYSDIDSALRQINQCKKTIILGDDLWNPTVFYNIILENELLEPPLGILLSLETEVLAPNVLFIPESELIILGCEEKVYFIDTHTNCILHKLKLEAPFFQFRYFEQTKQIVIIYETGIINCGLLGRIIWKFEAHDIINDWSFNNEIMNVKFFESLPMTLSLINGTTIHDS